MVLQTRKFVAALTVALAMAGTAIAGPYDALRDADIENSARRLAAADEAAASMIAVTEHGWDASLSQEYALAALEAVYFAYTAYIWDNDKLPADANELLDGGYLEQFPVNPYNAGEPVRVLASEAGFASGDLILQVAPRDFWSIAGSTLKEPRPVSFELGIYGPVNTASPSDVLPIKHNTWAVVPEGIVFLRGLFRETEQQTLKKRERRKQQKQRAVEAH